MSELPCSEAVKKYILGSKLAEAGIKAALAKHQMMSH